jgi:hypothetical protein
MEVDRVDRLIADLARPIYVYRMNYTKATSPGPAHVRATARRQLNKAREDIRMAALQYAALEELEPKEST